MSENQVKLMVVDDQKLICDGLSVVLNQMDNLEVIAIANDGKEAIDKAEELQPDVILMDIRMPIMGGITATSIIKEKYPQIKILMLTTFSDDAYILEALRNGASGYVLKDMNVVDLAKVIHQCNSGQIIIPQSIQPMLMQLLQKTERNEDPMSAIREKLQSRNIHLTKAEANVLKEILNGKSNKEISDSLFLSIGTIKNYTSKLYRKLGVSSRAEAIILVKNL